MSVYIVVVKTESGDNYLFAFDYAITAEEAKEFLRNELPEEHEDESYPTAYVAKIEELDVYSKAFVEACTKV